MANSARAKERRGIAKVIGGNGQWTHHDAFQAARRRHERRCDHTSIRRVAQEARTSAVVQLQATSYKRQATGCGLQPVACDLKPEASSEIISMTSDPVQLYSIGHSNVTVERLIALLGQHAVTMLCDVRSTPYSRYNPQFNRESLVDALRTTMIAYRFMGDTLGGKPADGALRTEDGALPDYDKIAASPAFLRGLDQLIALGTSGPTAFMCSEADYHTCHRHRLISPALIGRGVVVWHIMPDGGLERGEIEAQQMRMF
jgi:Protein of unknown function, DUF488